MLAYRDGKLCLIYETQDVGVRTVPIAIGLLTDGSADRADYLERLENALHSYASQAGKHDFRKISEIEIEPKVLNNYPNVKEVWQVRELFIRIFDLLGFSVLRSENTFPELVLLFGDAPYNTTVVVKASDYFSRKEQQIENCDLVICWEDDLQNESDDFEVLAISKFYDVFSP